MTTVYDLTMASTASGAASRATTRRLHDKDAAYTPAWQEIFTGVASDTVLQFAREWANTAEATEGKCMIIIGAGINHWYHANLMYRAGAMALMLTGCVGQERRWAQPLRRPGEAGADGLLGQRSPSPRTGTGPVRLQQAPIWHYINTCQYRYDGQFSKYNTVPDNE